MDPPDTSTPAVVLKLDANVFHHGGLGVIRSLGRMGVPVHVVHEDLLSPAAASRYAHGRWRWVPDSSRPKRIRQGLAMLGERIGRPSVLIATDDAGAIYQARALGIAGQLRTATSSGRPSRLGVAAHEVGDAGVT